MWVSRNNRLINMDKIVCVEVIGTDESNVSAVFSGVEGFEAIMHLPEDTDPEDWLYQIEKGLQREDTIVYLY